MVVVGLILVYLGASPGQGGLQAKHEIPGAAVVGARHVVPPDQIVSGGPPPDGIPSIDNPKFIAANRATFPSDSDVVIGIYYHGEAKAYPLPIMVWHEIVNDVVGGQPIAITYCPLCYSTVAYLRIINGQSVTFGTSGKLYNNNLVMYDRLTKSLWSQIWGEAILGNLTGYRLQRVPIDVMSWGEWKSLYPNTVVLSTDTGYSRPYGTDPYGSYYTDPSLIFPLSHSDSRLSVKERVLGVTISNASKAYLLNDLKPGVIQDLLGGDSLVLFVQTTGTARIFNPSVDGRVLHFFYSSGTFTDQETRSTWSYDGVSLSGAMQGKALTRYSPETAFWFSWAAYYPNTEIYGKG